MTDETTRAVHRAHALHGGMMAEGSRDVDLRDMAFALLRVMAALMLLQHALRTLFGLL